MAEVSQPWPRPEPTAKSRRQWERHRRLAVAVLDQSLATLDAMTAAPPGHPQPVSWRDGVAAARAAVQDLRDAIEGGGDDGGGDAGSD